MVDRRLRRLYALEGAVFSVFLPFFVLWLRDRGFSPSEIGVILSSSALVGVIAAPVWSSVADRRAGTVRTLQLAFVSAAVLAIALALTGSAFLAVVGVAAVLAVAQAPPTPLTDALAMRTLGPERLHGYGSFRLWASFGWGVGSIAFGALFQAAGLGSDAAGLRGRRDRCGRVRRALPSRAPAGMRRRDVAVRCGRARRSRRCRASRCSCSACSCSARRRARRGTTCRCRSRRAAGERSWSGSPRA